MKKYSVLLFGGSGKMGAELQVLIGQHPSLDLYKSVGSSLENVDPNMVDLVIDFSNQNSFSKIAKWSQQYKKTFLSGTTGLSKLDFELLKALSKSSAVFWSSNMSVGIYLLGLCLRVLGQKSQGAHFQYKIEETHHTEKKDSPSGTAISLSHILQSKNIDAEIFSKREADELGLHKVIINSDDESLVLEHRAHSRSVFAKGAVRAAEFLVLKPAGLYTMDDLFS